MIEVDLPEDEAVPEPARSFAACVASVTETPIAEVPQPRADLPGAIAQFTVRAGDLGKDSFVPVTLTRPAGSTAPRAMPK